MSCPDDEGLLFLPPRGLSLVSLLASALVSFFFLMFVLSTIFPLFFELIGGDEIGPLIFPIYAFSYVEALIGSLVFTVIGERSVMLERARPFPHWLPQAISFPVAWC